MVSNLTTNSLELIFCNINAIMYTFFCARLQLIETRGKLNKTVPKLLTAEMITAIDTLNKTRCEVGISTNNKFIFPSKGMGPLQAWKTINSVATEAGCLSPELISSSRLRKYIATVVQV